MFTCFPLFHYPFSDLQIPSLLVLKQVYKNSKPNHIYPQYSQQMTDFTLVSIMKYLKQNNYQQSWLSLQIQSNTKLFTYPKQIEFFRKIILKGDFDEAVQFFNTLKSNLKLGVYNNACLALYKQKLYELINVPNEKELKRLFQKDIVGLCQEEEFQQLFTMLTCRKTQQIQGLEQWTMLKGRLNVFQQLLPIVQNVLYTNKGNSLSYQNTTQPEINLDQVIAMYIQNQPNVSIPEVSLASNSKLINKSNLSQNSIKPSLANQNISSLSTKKAPQVLQLSQSQFQKSQFPKGLDKKPNLFQKNISSTKDQPLPHQTAYPNRSNLLRQSKNYSHSQVINPKNEYSVGSRLYQQEQINQISDQQQRSDTVRSINRIKKSKTQAINRYQQPQHNQSESQQMDSSRQDIEYLQQTNSVVYNNQIERDHQNFTFSHHNFAPEVQRPRKITKLATISDNKAIRTCRFSSTGSYFAVGTNSSILKIFQMDEIFSQNKIQQIEPIYQINGLHSKSIFCLDWARDESSMVTCSNDLTIKLTQFNDNFSSHEVSVIGRHESCIRMVKFNEAQNKIFSCGDDSLVKVWDMGKVKRCYNLKGHAAGISAFKLCENQNQLYSVSKDSTIKRWDLRTLECIATSKNQQSQMTYIANNTERIVASNRNGNVLFFDQELNLEYEVKIHEDQIRSIEASKSQQLYLTASFDSHLGIFSQKSAHSPDYFQHNQNSQDKVVYATFLDHPEHKGFASTSTLGLCHIYSYF